MSAAKLLITIFTAIAIRSHAGNIVNSLDAASGNIIAAGSAATCTGVRCCFVYTEKPIEQEFDKYLTLCRTFFLIRRQ